MKIPEKWTFKSDEVVKNFDTHVRETLPWYDLVTGAVAHICRHYIPTNGIVYDFGASTGNVGKAISETLLERKATLYPIDDSPNMGAMYQGPDKQNMIIADACDLEIKEVDVGIFFLTLMFIPSHKRAPLLARLLASVRKGGCLIIVDKAEAESGYLSTVMWRLTLAGKVASDIPPDQIVAKELSLGGVQRPLSTSDLPPFAVEFFRFGDFAGWVIEKQ